MAGRFKRTKDVGHQSGGGGGGGGGRAANLSATTMGSALSATRLREEKRKQEAEEAEELDALFDFKREVTHVRLAYLYNIRQSSIAVLEGKGDAASEESCLDMYFVEEDGKTFKASHIFQPYFLLQVKGNSTVYGEVEQYLLGRYAEQITKVEQFVKDDLDLPNHLAGHQRVYMKLSFRNVDDLVTVRRELLPQVEKNRRLQKQNEETGLDDAHGLAGRTAESAAASAGGAASGAGAAGASVSKKNKKRDECMAAVVDIREYDVQYVSRVCIDTDIRCGCWYVVTPEHGRRHSTLVRSDKKDSPPLKKMAFDIETTKPALKFPSAESDNIMMISYMIDGAGYLIVNRSIVAEDIEDFEYTPKPEYSGVFSIKNVPDEKALLEAWIAHIVEEKPLLYITYNGDYFDCQFRGIARMQEHGEWRRVSHIRLF